VKRFVQIKLPNYMAWGLTHGILRDFIMTKMCFKNQLTLRQCRPTINTKQKHCLWTTTLVTTSKFVDPLYMFHDKIQFHILKKYCIAKYLLFKSLRAIKIMFNIIFMDFLFYSNKPLIYNILSSIDRVFSLPSASFQNKSY
jgi:hypothetical protein